MCSAICLDALMCLILVRSLINRSDIWFGIETEWHLRALTNTHRIYALTYVPSIRQYNM